MIGLRSYARDASLPTRCGDHALAPLAEAELWAAVTGCMLRADRPAVEELRWEYARWRPHHTTCCAYTLRFADGEERILVAKRYAEGKHLQVAARAGSDRSLEASCDLLAPVGVLEERGLVLWGFPADRSLAAHVRLFDPRALARMLEDEGIVPPRSVRRRRLRRTLLRYKPENRSVWRLEVAVRGEEEGVRTYAARALRPARARRAAKARRAAAGTRLAELGPRMLAFDHQVGLLLEEWLDVETFAPDAFAHALTAGELLGRLHSQPLPASSPPPETSPPEVAEMFDVEAELAERFRRLHPAGGSFVPTWVHGDFHPDQVARTPEGRWKLLDLDLLGSGDPARDLASWVADHLEERPEDDFAAAATPLLEGHAAGGGPAIDVRHLRRRVVEELARSAAGALRRLEEGALDKAHRLLVRAEALQAAGREGR